MLWGDLGEGGYIGMITAEFVESRCGKMFGTGEYRMGHFSFLVPQIPVWVAIDGQESV